jgi:protein disulfide-isomerase A6
LHCVVANINGDDKNADINQKYGVTCFPTFKFLQTTTLGTDGDRTKAEIAAYYLNGTNRAACGGLNEPGV